MNNKLLSLLGAFAIYQFMVPLKCHGLSRQTASVVVEVVSVQSSKGTLRIALYDSKESYLNRKGPVRSAAVPVRGSTVTVRFTGLPPGWYAIMFYHDANDNGRFDRFLGLPREQYGFSNNATPGIGGPPDFDRAKFYLSPGQSLYMELKAR